jgi:hypothetical protein
VEEKWKRRTDVINKTDKLQSICYPLFTPQSTKGRVREFALRRRKKTDILFRRNKLEI